jgi:hypothetical protein
MSSQSSATYETLITAAATLLLALAYLIRRLNSCQFGTCCKLSISQNPEPPGLVEPQTELPNVIIPVVNEIVRRISKDNNNPPPEDSNTQIV